MNFGGIIPKFETFGFERVDGSRHCLCLSLGRNFSNKILLDNDQTLNTQFLFWGNRGIEDTGSTLETSKILPLLQPLVPRFLSSEQVCDQFTAGICVDRTVSQHPG